MNPVPSAEKPNKGKFLTIGLAVACILLTAKVVYDAIDKAGLIEEGRAMGAELQSTYQVLDSVQREVEAKISAIEELGGQVDTLIQVKAELEQEKASLQSRSRKEITRLRAKVEGYTTLLLEKDEEITRLKETNKVLVSENTNLKSTQNQLKKSISTLEGTQSQLKEKVALASRLEITPPTVEGIGHKGKPLSRLRAKALKALNISFSIKENEVAEADGKEILLRLLAPNGKVLFDVHRGAGSFLLNGKELFYTLKQDILYDKRNQQIAFLYDKQSPYPAGTYQIEIYTDGYLMGKGTFELK